MPIDPNQLLALWNLEDIPACDEGLELARAFLETCGRALESTRDEEFKIIQKWRAYIRHQSKCEKCNEV